jgi:hypothetical protein
MTMGANIVAFRLHSNIERAAVCEESVRYLTTLSVGEMPSVNDAMGNGGTILARKLVLVPFCPPQIQHGNVASNSIFCRTSVLLFYSYKFTITIIRPCLTNDCMSR